ncbi:transposable element Tc1 transposase [Trichonephila clavipes]|nr:transposable element Tc1 transposase [Trichonephila clavipes]
MTVYTNLGKVPSEEYKKSCIHENHSTGVACCKPSWQSSCSKTVNLGTECYEETTGSREHLNLTQLQREQAIRYDKSLFTLFRTTGRVFVCRTSAKSFHVDCLVPTVKHGGGSMMVWGAISSFGLRSLVVLKGMITGDHYRSILADHLHLMLQNFSLRECSV